MTPSSWSERERRVPWGFWRYAIDARTMTMGCYRMSVLHLANTYGERRCSCLCGDTRAEATGVRTVWREMLESWVLMFVEMVGALEWWIYDSNHRTKLGEPASIPSWSDATLDSSWIGWKAWVVHVSMVMLGLVE